MYRSFFGESAVASQLRSSITIKGRVRTATGPPAVFTVQFRGAYRCMRHESRHEVYRKIHRGEDNGIWIVA